MKPALRAVGALALVMGAASACNSHPTTMATPIVTQLVTQTPVPQKTAKPVTSAAADRALAEDGVVQCRKQPGADSQCNDDPNQAISQLNPRYGFAGPSLDNYSGTYFIRSSAQTGDWRPVWAAGAGPFPCSGNYPVPRAVLQDLGGCY